MRASTRIPYWDPRKYTHTNLQCLHIWFLSLWHTYTQARTKQGPESNQQTRQIAEQKPVTCKEAHNPGMQAGRRTDRQRDIQTDDSMCLVPNLGQAAQLSLPDYQKIQKP